MNRGLIIFIGLTLSAVNSQSMENAQFYIDRSHSMIDALGSSFKGPDAKDLVIAFKACKETIISSSGNDELNGLKSYKSKVLLKSPREAIRLKKLVTSLFSRKSQFFTPAGLLHASLVDQLEKRLEDLLIAKEVMLDKKGINMISVIPHELGQLKNLKEADLRRIARCTLAYAIASVAMRGQPDSGRQLDDSLSSRVMSLVDRLANQPVLGGKTKEYKRIARLFSFQVKDFAQQVPRSEFDPLKTITLHDLIGYQNTLNDLRSVTELMIEEFQSQPIGFSAPFRSYEALRATLVKINGLTIEETDIFADDDQESTVYVGLRNAPQLTKDDVNHVAVSTLSYIMLRHALGFFE